MRLSAFVFALTATALAGSASAAPIIVADAASPARDAPGPRCVALPASANGPDVECVVTLASGEQRPSRILIRTQAGQTRCPSNQAQVVLPSGQPARSRGLPLVEPAGGERACRF